MKFSSDSELYKTIGRNIKYFRELRKLTQSDLAELAGISLSYVSKLEAEGCEKSVSISTLNSIANALDVKLTNFFERTPPT